MKAKYPVAEPLYMRESNPSEPAAQTTRSINITQRGIIPCFLFQVLGYYQDMVSNIMHIQIRDFFKLLSNITD